MSEKIDFGFTQVDKDKKQSMVGAVFSSVAKSYDLMNDVMSLGLHRLWKKTMLNQMPLFNNVSLVDIASGTGDIGFSFIKKCNEKNFNFEVTLSDINEDMLTQAKKRAIDKNIKNFNKINWLTASAEELPIKDNSADYVTISFGIRNVTNRQKALEEFYRILKPGGKFICMEFSEVQNELFKKIYDFYSFNLIPEFGKIFAKDKESYQYLVESIRKFPKQDEFKEMIEKAGFENVNYKNLTDGAVAIHVGHKI